jgi:hypothetical protein
MTDYIRRNEHKTNDSNNTNSTDMNNNTGEVVPNTKILDLINFLSKKYLQVSDSHTIHTTIYMSLYICV